MFKSYKLIVIAAFLLFIFLFAILALTSIFNKTSPPSIVPTRDPQPTFYLFPTVAMDDLILPTVPVTDTIVIKDVIIKNFYPLAKDTNINGDVLVVDDPSYHIVYFPFRKTFLINILSSPFEDARIKTEEKFLQILGITREDACRLNVEIGTPRFANEDLAGQTFRLSFCENVTE